ncbi:protein FAR1-RELATED SEQUENCE 1-like [Castanea sativa]|uniref:protein FAR1-RELATED SEQUENCE 1-like n=1 Tax=Castanea sativa TaxID=21020 RepID=UPI003F64C08D
MEEENNDYSQKLDTDYIPKLGIEFGSEQEAYDFYNECGRNSGFSIRKEWCNKRKKDGVVTSRKFTCCKEGNKAPWERDGENKYEWAETRTGCNAHMIIRLDKKKGKSFIHSLELNHNHILHIPQCAHMMSSQRKVSKAQAMEIYLAYDSGIKLKDSYEFMARQVGGRDALAFFEAMSGKKPKTIFTNQDLAMAKAISLVMPNTYHRLCKWHLMQNALKGVNHVLRGEDEFRSDLDACFKIWEEEEEFLSAWDAILQKYNAFDNSWLQSAFEVKEKWAKAYVKMSFSVGMTTTQLSESINSDLKDYLQSDYDIVKFFIHFERLLDAKRYQELKEFQGAFVKERVERNASHEYIVSIYGKPKDRRVIWNPFEKIVSCSCRKFERGGILCSHALKILDVMDIKVLPEKYILKRWTKDAKNEIVQDFNGRDIKSDTKLEVTTRYKFFGLMYVKLIARASECEEAYELALGSYNELSKKIDDILRKKSNSCQDKHLTSSMQVNGAISYNPLPYIDHSVQDLYIPHFSSVGEPCNPSPLSQGKSFRYDQEQSSFGTFENSVNFYRMTNPHAPLPCSKNPSDLEGDDISSLLTKFTTD